MHSLDADWEKEIDMDLVKQTKVFLYHGKSDPMIPVTYAKKAYEYLREKGVDFSFTEESGL